jgi:hypothetical protein
MIHLIVLGLLAVVGVAVIALVVGTVSLTLGLTFGLLGLALRIAWIPFEIILGIFRALLHL